MCKVEYIALKKVMKEYIQLKYLFNQIELLAEFKSDNTLFTDSQSAREFSKNLEHYAKTKYINI